MSCNEGVWLLAAGGTFYSAANGAERIFQFDALNIGFRVKSPLVSLVVRARSDTSVKVRVLLDHGATADLAALKPLGDPIAAVALNALLPQTMVGSTTGPFLPWLRPSIGIQDVGGTTERWFTAELWVGGTPW
jgi:hypothetical protein